MTATVGGLNAQVMKLVIQNDIESVDAHKKMRRAANEQEIAQKEAQNAVEQYGRDLQSAQNWVNTGKAAVSAATAVGGVGQGVEASQTQGELGTAMNTDAANQVGGPGSTDGVGAPGAQDAAGTDPNAALKDVELFETDDGQSVTVGDRFTDDQLELLTSGDRFSKRELLDAGFSDREATELMMRQGDGALSQDQAAAFIQTNAQGQNGGLMARQTELLQRGEFTDAELKDAGFTASERQELLAAAEDGLTPAEMQDFMSNRNAKARAQSDFKSKIKDELLKLIDLGFQEGQKDVKDASKQAAETKDKLGDQVERMQDHRSEHRANLDDLELQGIHMQKEGFGHRRDLRG